MSFHAHNRARIRTGPLATSDDIGNNGAFLVPRPRPKPHSASPSLRVLVSDKEGWEHVAVFLPDRTPTWDEMCLVKALFWDDEDAVVQYHPPRSVYVNTHPHCLHLWRRAGQNFELPSTDLVGVAVPRTEANSEAAEDLRRATSVMVLAGVLAGDDAQAEDMRTMLSACFSGEE